jgi:hypothetical protein
VEDGLASVVLPMEDGSTVEVGVIGRAAQIREAARRTRRTLSGYVLYKLIKPGPDEHKQAPHSGTRTNGKAHEDRPAQRNFGRLDTGGSN